MDKRYYFLVDKNTHYLSRNILFKKTFSFNGQMVKNADKIPPRKYLKQGVVKTRNRFGKKHRAESLWKQKRRRNLSPWTPP